MAVVAALVAAGAVWVVAGGAGLDERRSLVVAAATVGAANGAISGWRRIYDWRRRHGWLAAGLDSSWALLPIAGSLFAHVVAAAQRDGGGYLAALSERRNRHVYSAGFRVRPGFLTTIGNVVGGVGAPTSRRRDIVEHHEDVHVWQARWFGPLFPLLYGGWLVVGTVVGAGWWLVRRRRGGHSMRLSAAVDAVAYYSNPFEWWAYCREDRWPPPHAAGSPWRRRRIVGPRRR